MEFTPHGVCSKNIHLEVDEAGRIHVSKVSNVDTKQHPARISFHLL